MFLLTNFFQVFFYKFLMSSRHVLLLMFMQKKECPCTSKKISTYFLLDFFRTKKGKICDIYSYKLIKIMTLFKTQVFLGEKLRYY